MITSYDTLPQDDKCQICKKRIGDHKNHELWKCLQFSSLCIKNIDNTLSSWVTLRGKGNE